MIGLATAADRGEWDSYVAKHPDAAGYHEWAWRDVFERAFGHTSHYLIARNESSITGVLPLTEIRSLLFGRSLTSLPFINFGGVLANSPEIARALVDEAGRLAMQLGSRHVELRHIARQFDHLPVKQHKVTMRLDLRGGSDGGSHEGSHRGSDRGSDKGSDKGSHKGPGNLWDRIDRKARNQVRKAQKSNFTVARGGVELLGGFYEVFARNMRDLGTPVYAQQFFRTVLEAFPGRVHLIVVRLGDRPVAAGLTYRTKGMVEIPWASSIREFNSLCPNHLLYWHALETAAAEGAETFDFGRSTPGEGTFKFKEQWGADPVALHWEYWLPAGKDLPDQSPKNPKYRLMIATWQRMPLWAANAIGPRLVKDIP